MRAVDDLVLGRMSQSPLLVLSETEIERIVQQVHTPEEIARALFDYAFICWQRGQRFEFKRAIDAAASPWNLRDAVAVW